MPGVKMWCTLAAVKLLLTVLPQNGYIHPDEFFQTVEITAGDILRLDVLRAWEFNSTSPIRSITLPYVMTAPAFLVIRFLTSFPALESMTSPYFLLVIPRLIMMVISFITDIIMFRLAGMLGYNPRDVLLTYATSFLPYVFFTRTFSNTIEAFLFIFLVYFITKSFSKVTQSTRQGQRARSFHDTGQSHRSKSQQKFACVIGFIVVVGIFNRPTFVAFAIAPYLVWLTSGNIKIFNRNVFSNVLTKGLTSGAAGLFTAIVIILCDSMYYGSLPIDVGAIIGLYDKHGVSGLVSSLSITPITFLLYNTRKDNLAEHGIHPHFTHFLVNAPLLFNVLAIFGACSMMNKIWTLISGGTGANRKPFTGVMILSYSVPLFILSLFPHQEPRFLLPLLAPLVILYASSIYGRKSRFAWRALWLLLNGTAGIFFGLLHQGGMIPSIRYLHGLNEQPSVNVTRNVIFYQTYMPPRHLFVNSAESCRASPVFDKICEKMNIHDLKGSSRGHLHGLVELIKSELSNQEVYIVAPATVDKKVQFKSSESKLRTQVVQSFCPHVSTENLPKLDTIRYYNSKRGFLRNMSYFIRSMSKLLCLNVYKVM